MSTVIDTPKGSTSTWPLYLAAGGLGIAFLITLLVLAWDNALEAEVQRFGFESLSVDETVRSRATSAHDALANLTRVFSVVPDLTERQFLRLANEVLGQFTFVTAVGRYQKSNGNSYSLFYAQDEGDERTLPQTVDLNAAGGYGAVFSAAEVATGAIPSEKLASGNGAGQYVLAQAIPALETASGTPDIVVLLIKPNLLLENIAASADLGVQLFSESEGVGGRQLLYERTPVVSDEDWQVDILEHSTQIRFDRYSIRLIANKALYWGDLGKALLFTALVLGVGVTLLLVALARAKELQARELLARNRVIEDQVTRQTFELAEARDHALEASRVKSDFLASMSHEIRTPLNAIIGMAELLSDTKLSGDQIKFVSVFKNAGEALLSLVNDILDLSKIEAGQLILEDIEFDVREIVEQSAEIYALKTDAKNIELSSHIGASVPPRVKGDPSRLRQIILNLIGNAIKFTDNGEIVVRVACTEMTDSTVKLLFSVADTGIGIPKDKLQTIFGSFTQVDSSTTRKYGGTGLGLTISQKLVEKMRGRIWAESEEGMGSTFKFEIETSVVEASDIEAQKLPDLHGTKVLVVDDNQTNRFILKESITS
ncbi:MAG: ATP-binding protein, partial [Gammaproteobacteria bacterium]